jgi:hypothetical protein
VQLLGRNDHSLTLSITRYEFADAEDDWDANWLMVRAEVRNDEGNWSASAPCLTTREVAELAAWLDAPAGELDFTEPNLMFECVEQCGDDVELRVWFELELRPEWAMSRVAGARDLSADLAVSSAELTQAATELRRELETFPPRGGWA